MPSPPAKGNVPLAPLPSPLTSLTAIMALPLLRSRTALQSPHRGYEPPSSRMSPLQGDGYMNGRDSSSICSRLNRAQLGRILDQALLISASLEFGRESRDFVLQDDDNGINDPSSDNE